jgi:hypothetical protein
MKCHPGEALFNDRRAGEAGRMKAQAACTKAWREDGFISDADDLSGSSSRRRPGSSDGMA